MVQLSLQAVNHLKSKLVLLQFKYTVVARKKTQPAFITGIIWLMLFREIITACPENHMKM
jgi:hypothetical protein